MNNRTALIRNKGTHVGTWLTTGSTMITELAGQYAFHWLLFDMEHGNVNNDTLLSNFQAVRNNDIAVIVRIPGLNPELIAKVLDLGADGIMVPHVSDAAQAKACVAAMYYPPAGNRGYSSSVRAFRYGNALPADLREVSPLLFVQIEDPDGVTNANAIASVQGVDVLFVGPADLRLSLAVAPVPAMDFENALKTVVAAAAENKKKAGILVRDYADTASYIQGGFECIAMGSDLAILRQGYQHIITTINGA